MACPLCCSPLLGADADEQALIHAFWLGIEALDTEAAMHRTMGNDALAHEALRDASVLRDFANAQELRGPARDASRDQSHN